MEYRLLSRKITFFLFALAILSIDSSPIQAQNTTDASQKIDQYVETHPIAGLAVAVVKDGKIIYAYASGKKNIEKYQQLDTSALFRIASVSKSFTVTSLMQLIEKGQFSLDDDVSDLIGFHVRNPRFPDKVITLGMLLSHTSSLSDKNGYFNLDVINPNVNLNYAKCYNDYEPGTQYEYCNLALNMAGTILERQSGERFDHYVADSVLKPLGIYGGYNVNDLDSNRFAHLYEYDTAKHQFIPSPGAYAPRTKEIEDYQMGYSTPVFSPTGGMKISIGGLATYMIMHMNYGEENGVRIISRESEEAMRQPQLSGDSHQYGLGLHHSDNLIPGVSLIGHTGDAYGLYSSMFFEPNKKFGFVVITNGADPHEEDGFQYVLKDVNNILYNIFLGN